jgi:Histidine kinase-like ATPase domain
MARTATEAGQQLIAFVLPGLPESVPVARRRVRAALGLQGLGEYADDAELITSELVTNAVQHACHNGSKTIGATLAVSDSSPDGPIRRDTSVGSEQGRGLQIVAALSAHWGWRHEDGEKVVFAVLAREA